MSIADVRAGFGTALRTISGLNVDDYVVEGVRPPHAMVDWEADYDMTFARGADVYTFSVLVFAQRANPEQSQKLLDTYRDPSSASSIKTALEGNATLGALVDYVRVQTVDRPQVVTVGNADYLMVTFGCEVVI